jgi:hypothetical protein
VKFESPLAILARADVRFVVVGGVAMNLQGSAASTTDLDIVYDRSSDNVARLVAALAPYAPRLRGALAGIRFRFDEHAVRNGMNFTLSTTLGDIDLLGEVSGVGGYDAAHMMSKAIDVEGTRFQVLTLRGLIRAKRAAGRPKDRLVLPELEALAELEDRTEMD